MAAEESNAQTLNFNDQDIYEKLTEMTGGMGPDSCIDAVGLEAHGTTVDAIYDRAKTAMYLATDRSHALRQAIRVCRKGGTISVPGVYRGFSISFPLAPRFKGPDL
jgi:threonine dehydrogenase-like Zn-dependent dehydrogenase